MGCYVTHLTGTYGYPTPGFTQMSTNGYGSTAMASTSVGEMDTEFGKKMPVVHINMRMAHSWTSGTTGLYSFNTDYKPALDAIWNDGRIPFCTWGLWDLNTRSNNYAMRLAAIANGDWDTLYFIPFFQQAATWAHPFWVRPWWEFNVNGGWSAGGNFPWCVGTFTDGGHTWTNTSADFVNAWRHVVDLRNTYGARNVNFVWCPNIQSSSTSSKTNPTQTGPLTNFWPGLAPDGTNYVDWMGPDGYQTGYVGSAPAVVASSGSWASLQQIMTGASGLGLLNTWSNVQACDTTGRIPMCIPETNADLKAFANTSDSTGRIGRAAYIKEAYDVSTPALTRMGLLGWFNTYHTTSGEVYQWEEYDDQTTSLDGVNRSPNSSGNANLNTALADFAAAKASFASSFYPDKANITLPANLKPIRPYWLEDVPDRYRKAVKNGLPRGYWRAQETVATSGLADDTGNGFTATLVSTFGGTMASANTVVPSNPTDVSVATLNTDATTAFTLGNSNANWSPATIGAMTFEVPFILDSTPVNFGYLGSKGDTNLFEWDVGVNTTSNITFFLRTLTNAPSTELLSTSALPTTMPSLVQAWYDGGHMYLVASSATGGSWGDIVNTSGAWSSTLGNGTAAFELMKRVRSVDHCIPGKQAHMSFYPRSSIVSELQERYNCWIAAPVLSAISSGTPTTTGATITWTTNIGATTWLEYGPTTGYGSSSGLIDPALVTSHSATLTGLSVGTVYHYKVHSRNPGGTDSVSADQTFTTAGASTSTMKVMVVA
jgi:hypothetical protein